MRKSKKILIVMAGLFLALLLASIIVFRVILQDVVHQYSQAHRYKTLPIEVFDRIEIQGSWEVLIRQGRESKLEVAEDWYDQSRGLVNFSKGALVLNNHSEVLDPLVSVRVTLQNLTELKASKGASVVLEGFEGDSLTISLADSTSFSGRNNTFLHQGIKTVGNVTLELTGDPYD